MIRESNPVSINSNRPLVCKSDEVVYDAKARAEEGQHERAAELYASVGYFSNAAEQYDLAALKLENTIIPDGHKVDRDKNSKAYSLAGDLRLKSANAYKLSGSGYSEMLFSQLKEAGSAFQACGRYDDAYDSFCSAIEIHNYEILIHKAAETRYYKVISQLAPDASENTKTHAEISARILALNVFAKFGLKIPGYTAIKEICTCYRGKLELSEIVSIKKARAILFLFRSNDVVLTTEKDKVLTIDERKALIQSKKAAEDVEKEAADAAIEAIIPATDGSINQ